MSLLLPFANRYFRSENLKGYQDSYKIKKLDKAIWLWFKIMTWALTVLCINFDRFRLISLILLVVANHNQFVRQRWKSLARGLGAPGFMLYWCSCALLLLEILDHVDRNAGVILSFVIVIDFATIMVTAGIYKIGAGYRKGTGIEYGMVNPQWSYFPEQLRHIPIKIRSLVFRLLNESSWLLEIFGGTLLVFHISRWLGAVLIALTFVCLIPIIRLGFLCLTVLLCVFIVSQLNEGPVSSWRALVRAFGDNGSSVASKTVILSVVAYFVVMLFVRGVQLTNVFRHRQVQRLSQGIADRIANFFGIILWRVFTPDVTAFWIRVEIVESSNNAETSAAPTMIISNWGKGRYFLVSEAITLTSVFTLPRYFPHNRELFENRLRRYANSLGVSMDVVVRFVYIEINKQGSEFVDLETAFFDVDIVSGVITSEIQDRSLIAKPFKNSPVRAGIKLGSYVQRKL
jgi:hypothetical protein